MRLSIVIRALNEARFLPDLLVAISGQELAGDSCEVILVDSGSTDGTVQIAEEHLCKVVHIPKRDFSFGRSLNLGCAAAEGEVLVFISGHCIPYDRHWLKRLIEPFSRSDIGYTYGRQIGGQSTHFSEHQIFAKYFPKQSQIPQDGFYCNNANAALLRRDWEALRFDEDLTGVEDMYLAKQLIQRGRKLAYVADATVYHLHHETWRQVKRRFEREAIALQRIMPEVHLGLLDVLRYAVSAILLDWGAALQDQKLSRVAFDVVQYRVCQFWGAYRGNHRHRQMSHAAKERYYYPR
jgi:glycosyltransferase involved in cell wall biosynthesis